MPEFVKIGNLYVGKEFPVRVQSMLNTDTSDTEKCVGQSLELAEVGCEMIRLSTRNVKDAENLYNIKNELIKKNVDIPIIADIHFNPKIAEIAAEIADKIRINPGNYIDKNLSKTTFSEQDTKVALERAGDELYKLVQICKANNTVIRVGSNQGSLSERIVYNYGDTAKGMIVSVFEFIEIFDKLDFHDLVISLKSSNPLIMIEANRDFNNLMKTRNQYFPIHLGVTEAGSGMEGRIKSAIGIGTLLSEGIGDTIRVSLSENPVNEIVPAKIIAESKNNIKYKPTDNFERKKIDFSPEKFTVVGKDISEEELDSEIIIADISNKTLKEACDVLNTLTINKPLIIKYIEDEKIGSSTPNFINTSVFLSYIILNFPVSGIITNIDDEIVGNVLQTLRLKIDKPEYISCPTCARTEYNLESVLEEVKARSKHLKNTTIAVMGCIVNGPGEMRGADIGIVGYGKGKVVMFINGKQVGEPFPAEEAAEKIHSLCLDENGKNESEG